MQDLFCDMSCAWFYACRLPQLWWCFVICHVFGFMLAGFHSLDDVLWYKLCMVENYHSLNDVLWYVLCMVLYLRVPQPWWCFVISLVHGFILAVFHSLDDFFVIYILVLCFKATIALMMFCDMSCAWIYPCSLPQPWWCFVICLVNNFMLTSYHSLDDVLCYVLCMVLCL